MKSRASLCSRTIASAATVSTRAAPDTALHDLSLARGREAGRATAAHWDIVGDSGNVKTRAFCPTCGSPVYLLFTAMPGIFTIHAASLDDPARFNPQVVTYGVRGYDWDNLDPALPKFDKSLPANS